jgi:hypothetical protein
MCDSAENFRDGKQPVGEKMEHRGRNGRLAAVAAVALLALAVVPALAVSASASATPSAANPAILTSREWAYGGEGWSAGGITLGHESLTWNATAGAVVIYNATNTSATTTEITATRTMMERLTATFTAPNVSWTYQFKVLEVDHAYANLTDLANVTLANLSVVPALGLLNAEIHGNVTLAASLVGHTPNGSVSDYLNVSGWANAQVSFTPALGLVPLNLTGVTSWTAAANATGSAAWNLTWSFVNHDWNGTSASASSYISGTWSTATEVVLFGHVAGTYAKWVDHRLRTALALGLTGPFDLYAGVFLVPHGFDLFQGGAKAYASSGLGTTVQTSEFVFVSDGPKHLYAASFTAANFTAGTSTPAGFTVGGGDAPAVTPAASSGPTVWEQPESPSAAQSQANCFATGCPAGSNPFGGLLLPLAIAGLAIAVIAGVALSRRSRGPGGKASDTPLSSTPTSMGPTPPTGPVPP